MASNNLVALGTAAVIAVYAAGFERTRAAAQKFADADAAQRRPAPPAARQGEKLISPAPPEKAPDASNPGREVTPLRQTVDTTRDAPVIKSVVRQDTAAAEKAAPLPSQAPDTAAKTDSAQKERGPYKDGTYYGWGTSRHGDIQAGVEIINGRITAAWIQECLTQYSCSWIARLPGQVETRQSADVDFISGATQSTNAFYYGVVQALSKAR